MFARFSAAGIIIASVLKRHHRHRQTSGPTRRTMNDLGRAGPRCRIRGLRVTSRRVRSPEGVRPASRWDGPLTIDRNLPPDEIFRIVRIEVILVYTFPSN